MDLTPNCIYQVHHSSGMIRWKFTYTSKISRCWANSREVTRHHGINLATGREIILKSTAKIRCELESPHGTEAGRGNYF